MPVLGEPSTTDLVCADCLTPEVRDLRRRLSTDIEHFFDYLNQLIQLIGYTPVCTECLYQKTGVDLRRRGRKDVPQEDKGCQDRMA